MKFVVSGGGTGGHLIPGIAVYEEIKKRGFECKYVLRSLDLRYTVVSRVAEGDRYLTEISGISRKLSLKTPIYLLKILKTFFQIFGKVRKFSPDVILIAGGYVSNPVALSARLLNIPLYIIEQNSVAGATNRYYSKFAKAVFTSFPETYLLERAKKTMLTGNPSIFSKPVSKKTAMGVFGFKDCQTVLGITGGSQGAQTVNDAVWDALPTLWVRGISLIWSVGAVDFDRFEAEGRIEEIKKNYPNVRAYRFIERMDAFFSLSDLIITRAGATSIAEMIHFEKPSVLIPIPNSPDNHQFLNANYLEQSGGGEILLEEDLSKESLLSLVDSMLDKLGSMRSALKKLKPLDPAKKILDEILSEEEDGKEPA